MTVTCCPLSGCDGEVGANYDANTTRSPVDQKCIECRGAIPAGAEHELATWGGPDPDEDEDPEDDEPREDDPDEEEARTCAMCVEIRNHFACGEGWIFGQIWDDLEENFFPDMKAGGPCMDGLSPAAKACLFETRDAWLEGPSGRDHLELKADNLLANAIDELRRVDPERAARLEAQADAHANAKAQAAHLKYKAERDATKQHHLVAVQQEEDPSP